MGSLPVVACLIGDPRYPRGKVLAIALPQHPADHRPKRPILLAVDQETPSSWLVQFGHRVAPIAMSVCPKRHARPKVSVMTHPTSTPVMCAMRDRRRRATPHRLNPVTDAYSTPPETCPEGPGCPVGGVIAQQCDSAELLAVLPDEVRNLVPFI